MMGQRSACSRLEVVMSDCYAHIVAVGVRSTQLLRLIGIAMATASLLVSILPATDRADETLFASNF